MFTILPVTGVATSCVAIFTCFRNAAPSSAVGRIIWLRTNEVTTNGAAAKVRDLDRFGNNVRPGTFGKIKVG